MVPSAARGLRTRIPLIRQQLEHRPGCSEKGSTCMGDRGPCPPTTRSSPQAALQTHPTVTRTKSDRRAIFSISTVQPRPLKRRGRGLMGGTRAAQGKAPSRDATTPEPLNALRIFGITVCATGSLANQDSDTHCDGIKDN
ncbi:hypothetical protein E2C01_054674 [Portunus trituberculatus]|uniref:Uncharacterized protein n=1 Tax=Portunus trituberculatus TaxID=210409 RepID=A0A5B7GKJ0_PORTR|nr:hypothetical protein [Portunus trituberculatus]